jgi:hypothetical protein
MSSMDKNKIKIVHVRDGKKVLETFTAVVRNNAAKVQIGIGDDVVSFTGTQRKPALKMAMEMVMLFQGTMYDPQRDVITLESAFKTDQMDRKKK